MDDFWPDCLQFRGQSSTILRMVVLYRVDFVGFLWGRGGGKLEVWATPPTHHHRKFLRILQEYILESKIIIFHKSFYKNIFLSRRLLFFIKVFTRIYS